MIIQILTKQLFVFKQHILNAAQEIIVSKIVSL